MLRRNLTLFLRLLNRQKIFFLISISGLAVGIASFFLIALYVTYELSFDSFHTNGPNLYRVSTVIARTPVPLAPAMQSRIAGVEKASRMIFTSSGSQFIIKDKKGNLFEEGGYYVDSTFFDLFTFNFIGTRPPFPLHRPNEVIITQRIAEKYFPNGQALNQQIEFVNSYFDDHLFTVVGIIENIPQNSQFKFDLLLPYSRHGTAESRLWTNNTVYTFVKLSPHADPKLVHAELKKILATEAHYSEADLKAVQLQPFTKLHFEDGYTFDFGPHNRMENILILASVALLILLIACINFVNLSTAKASERMKEVGLKKTVGAEQSGLIIQFLTESIFVSLFATLCAAGITLLSAPWFGEISDVSFYEAIALIKPYFPLLILFPFLIGILAGIYPAYLLSAFKPIQTLQGQLQYKTKSTIRNALVIVQFFITGFLIISTLIISSQLNYILNKDLGFDDNAVLILNVGGPGINEKIHVLRSELSNNPDIINISGSLTLPGDYTYTMPYSDKTQLTDTDLSEANDLAGFYVDHEFVNNMGLEVINGRAFNKESSLDTLNFILNEAAVKELAGRFGAEWNNPVDKQLNYFRSSDQGWYLAKSGTVIGVVRDFNFASLHHEIKPLVIQVDYNLLYKVLVKIKTENISATLHFLKEKWQALNMERPFNYQFLDERIALAYEKEQKFKSLFELFSSISIIISCMGLYGLVLYTTERRSKEISIRKVLGANDASIVVLLGKGFINPVLWSFIIVSPIAYQLMSTWLEQFAFREVITPLVFIKSAGICIALSILTILSRTLKITRANPVEHLKDN